MPDASPAGFPSAWCPVPWDRLDDLIGGEHFSDLPAQVALISTLLMFSVVAALIVF